MSDLRVPPAVNLAFEQLVLEVCNEAKLDYEDWPLKTHELISHLQQRWREGIEKGLSTEAAEEQAIELFGDVQRTSKYIREPFLKRLLFYRRYRAHRYIFIWVCSVFVAWVGLVFFTAPLTVQKKGDDFNLNVYLGYFLNGIFAVGSVAVVRWRPKLKSLLLRTIFAARYGLCFFIFTGLFNLVVTPFFFVPGIFRHFSQDTGLGIIVAPIVLVLIPTSILAGVCLLSELLGWAERKKRQIPAVF